MKLYEVTTELEALWQAASDVLEPGNADEAEQAKALAYLEQQLKTLEGTHAEKCLNLACLIKNTEADASALEDEIAKLVKRANSAQARANWLRTYLAGNMEPGTNLKDARAVIGWRKSQAVEVTVKPEELPENLRRTTVTVAADKAAIKTNLEAGQEVAGAKLVTRFNIQIK